MTPADLRIDDAVERMGDREIYLEIAGFFADSIPSIKEGLQAALQRGDWPELRRLAHSLKSNCATVGAENLRGVAYTLETAGRDGDADTARTAFQTLSSGLDSLRDALRALR